MGILHVDFLATEELLVHVLYLHVCYNTVVYP